MHSRDRTRRLRLRLEALENRTVPSVSVLSALRASPAVTLSPAATAATSGLTPAQVRHAYGIDKLSQNGSGQTIAVVTAFDDPNIAADLKTFDKAYGLTDPAFTKVNLAGRATDSGWAGETALDVEWAHAVAPKAKIVLVEAASDSLADLLRAVDAARSTAGVSVVSMSWGTNEFRGETGYDAHFTTPAGHTPVAFVAAAGDGGAWEGPIWPSVAPTVLSVGGTTLSTGAAGGSPSESAWYDGGGGYSWYEREPNYQLAVQSSGSRQAPDVAYDADPRTGFAVYDSVPDGGYVGWSRIGGTSAGAPQWAGLIALADQSRAAAGKSAIDNAPAAVYTLSATAFHDVTRGSNGYRARAGFDLATGRGSPDASLVVPGLAGLKATATAATVQATAANRKLVALAVPFALPSVPTTAAGSTTAPAVALAAAARPAVSPLALLSPTPTVVTPTATAAVVVAPTAPITAARAGDARVAEDDVPADDDTEAQVAPPTPAAPAPMALAAAIPAAVPVPVDAPPAESPTGESAGDRSEAGTNPGVLRRSWAGMIAAIVAVGVAFAARPEARDRQRLRVAPGASR